MKKLSKILLDCLPWCISLFVAGICAIFITLGQKAEDGSITLDGKNAKIEQSTEDWIEKAKEDYRSTILYAKETVPAKIMTENGEETITVPTIESIDGTKLPENGENIDGRGAYHDTSSYLAYYNSVGLNACINNSFGAQCFALADDFWQNYAGRALSSCGTGAAKGTLNCYEHNAGDEFEMVWDVTKVQPGDWVVTTNGTWGHIFMAMGYYNGGYIAGFGQNQGGSYCPLGGSGTNVVNLNMSSFGGAFRPKTYVNPEPEPEPAPQPMAKEIRVRYGDTMGKIMLEQEGSVTWGKAMEEYANSWCSVVFKPGQSVLYGWTHGSGVGLYAGDTIRRCN